MDDDLERYIQQEEGFRQDFKRKAALQQTEKIAKHLSAFANRRGGRLIFGVTDDREIEGVNIDSEKTRNDISRIARTSCDPPVGFTENYYPDVTIDGRTGDVFLVQIDPYKFTPHAVLESGGATRTYYIRTADESRPISNSNELRRLFRGHPPKRRKFECEIWTVFEQGEYSHHRAYPSPAGTGAYNEFFRRLKEPDKEIIRAYDMADEEENVGKMRPVGARTAIGLSLQEISPYLYLWLLLNQPADFWIENSDRDISEQELFHQYSETRRISPTDLTRVNQSSMLSSFSFDPGEIIDIRNRIAMPRESSIEVSFPSAEQEHSSLIFERADLLRIEVKFLRVGMNSVSGYPVSYPSQGDNSGSPQSESVSIEVEAEFGFPDIEDGDIGLHQAFTEGIIDFTQEMWDWENYMEDVDRVLYRLETKIDDISDSL